MNNNQGNMPQNLDPINNQINPTNSIDFLRQINPFEKKEPEGKNDTDNNKLPSERSNGIKGTYCINYISS